MKPFEQQLHQLLKLHALMQENNGDSAEADELRDQMDKPWYAMSDSERALISSVSEALYNDERTTKE